MPKPARDRKLKVAALPKADVIADYKIGFMSRLASLIGRKEVLSGKAKFGIFGDGKEVAQLAMARAFRHGDWRSGYYRDQTFMFALGATDVRKFFAQLYADTDLDHEPASGGRQMNGHFATRYLDENGNWLNQLMMHNTSADASPTGCQMARVLGLAYASKLYRANKKLADNSQFSVKGNEVAFATIGNASTSEGIFWETLNAAGVLEVPLVVSVWDDDYGISVPAKYQTTKESISQICAGFQKEDGTNGYEIYRVEGWDYPKLVETYATAVEKVRKTHTPAMIHVVEMTQPQGHSTSGSHERYKSKERLELENSRDCLTRMRDWMIREGIASAEELDKLEDAAREEVERERKQAWQDFLEPMQQERDQLIGILERVAGEASDGSPILTAVISLKRLPALNRKAIISTARRVLVDLIHDQPSIKEELLTFIDSYKATYQHRYSSHLFIEGDRSALKVAAVSPHYDASSESIDGRLVIQRCFDHHLAQDPRLFIIGEDVGQLGGVNLEFEGLSEKHGDIRVTDTGIREATILGQGIGAAMRGLRPIVDIQYLDYLLYAFQVMSDDLATLHYRSAGGQAAPVIVRTKGHRLEGIWHTGSPMGTIIHGSRGMHVCVPRNMVQATGLYNTLLKSDDPALVIEVLNGYRLKETVPTNLTDFCLPLGVPEILRPGSDVTIVTYGACIRIVEDACKLLEKVGIDAEIIDVQTLLPFDRPAMIRASLEKTNAVIFVDEDVPGGASAFMMREVLEKQGGYELLDAPPRTVTAQEHRSPYGSDGDYFAKPNAEDVFEATYALMRERFPHKFPSLT